MASAADNPRMEVVECERQIQQIKTALRKIATEEGGDDAQNSLRVVWTGIDSTEADGVEVSLQLSSPVEEATLSKVQSSGDEAEETSSASFSGVESSMATLTVTLKKGDVVVGTSESYDLSPICSLEDAMNPKEEYVTELPVAIISPEGAAAAGEAAKKGAEETATADSESKGAAGDDAEETQEGVEESKDESAGKKEEEEEKPEAEEDKKETVTLIKPAATLTLKLVFKPSAKDQKEELYELLNKTSLRKSEALGRLREQQTALTKQSGPPSKKPGAVKAGFLNKKPKKAEESKWKKLYDKYIGPQSMARTLVIPISKNYVIFFGAAILMHFKGQELALPAPV